MFFRLQRKSIYKKTIVFTLICILLIVFFIGTAAPNLVIGFVIGVFFIGVVSHIKGIRTYTRTWKNNVQRICESTYEYKLFKDYIGVIGIISPMNDYGIYDFVLVYNVDTGEYNTLPNRNGKYRFINILYMLEENQMKIVEYDIDYVK